MHLESFYLSRMTTIGVPTEIKPDERRVGMTPGSVRELTTRGHRVLVQSGAGVGAGFDDAAYVAIGAEIVADAVGVFGQADLVVKVKEPQAVERAMLRPGQTLFTYLHLAPDPDQTHDLLASGATCIAYETVRDAHGGLPLLSPMSQVAGRLSVQAGATALESPNGGAGVLLGGVPGVAPAEVTVIGGGTVGRHAMEMAVGLGARVTVLDTNVDTLEALSARFGPAIRTLYSTGAALEDAVIDADLVIGAVLIPGASAPKLVTAEMIAAMRAGSVVVDVAIDQGGCFETSRATTHGDPTYVVDGVVHYCVANMPGAVPRTSTAALNHATLRHTIALAEKGTSRALLDDPLLLPGLNVHAGRLTEAAVGVALGIETVDPAAALAA